MGAEFRAQTIGFIGAGRVATGLALSLADAGYRVVTVASRTEASVRRLVDRIPGCMGATDPQVVADAACMVFITTPDGAIRAVADRVRWREGQRVVHCSGSLSLEPLEAAAAAGAITGSLHPLQTFGPPELAVAGLVGTAFGIQAPGGLYEEFSAMAVAMGGTPFLVPVEARALYHAAGVMSCGYLVALLSAANSLWERAGLPSDLGASALGHLALTTMEQTLALGPGPTLTGPLVRDDMATVADHLHQLAKRAPDLLPMYVALGHWSLDIAMATGRINPPAEATWRDLFDSYKQTDSLRDEV